MSTTWRWMAPAALLALTAQAAEPINVSIGWQYKDIAAHIELYEAKGYPRLWETRSVKSVSDLPIAGKIDSAAFKLRPGEKKRFVLVMRNDTDKPLYFFAAPHQVSPVEHSLGFKFKCLCVNHAFIVGPKETWYRVVELHMSQGFVGDALAITHTIIGIDEKRAKEFSQPAGMPDM
jgi:hypothetical protein